MTCITPALARPRLPRPDPSRQCLAVIGRQHSTRRTRPATDHLPCSSRRRSTIRERREAHMGVLISVMGDGPRRLTRNTICTLIRTAPRPRRVRISTTQARISDDRRARSLRWNCTTRSHDSARSGQRQSRRPTSVALALSHVSCAPHCATIHVSSISSPIVTGSGSASEPLYSLFDVPIRLTIIYERYQGGRNRTGSNGAGWEVNGTMEWAGNLNE